MNPQDPSVKSQSGNETIKILTLCSSILLIKTDAVHNGENDSHKRQFLALGVHSQYWMLDNLSKKILVKLTGVTSCLLQFDRIFFAQ